MNVMTAYDVIKRATHPHQGRVRVAFRKSERIREYEWPQQHYFSAGGLGAALYEPPVWAKFVSVSPVDGATVMYRIKGDKFVEVV